ncbi:hypothetical protein [Deinococcus yavapaiensis]|uniref:Uncharacterized protein n=1 Tax=Deinococcus yavapaiensis KR-236 TaxID=694435 RepID=A0A318SJE6_9DEIO|nr:hypothetical protein [Deinococcus yavapaiensis]PYE52063.1 hypothetical protein DES52_113109 [Deinococcus yavapaiensis KR-236]
MIVNRWGFFATLAFVFLFRFVPDIELGTGIVLQSNDESSIVQTINQLGGLKFLFTMVISLIVLVSSLFVVLSKRYPADAQKWAFGSLGTVIGYWLAK